MVARLLVVVRRGGPEIGVCYGGLNVEYRFIVFVLL